MTVIIVSIVIAWILFGAFMIVIVCMNLSKLNRQDEAEDPDDYKRR